MNAERSAITRSGFRNCCSTNLLRLIHESSQMRAPWSGSHTCLAVPALLAMFAAFAPTAQARSKAPAQSESFDAQKAYNHAAHLVEFGPRPPGSDAIHKAQQYIAAQLKQAGCQVSEREFHAPTPAGNIAMKNIVAIAPGKSGRIALIAAHYDTVRMPNFVGADDGAAGTGV